MAKFEIVCERCGRGETRPQAARCTDCGGVLGFRYPLAEVRLPERPGRLWDYADLLPLDDAAACVSLGEGGTPLVPAARQRGCRHYWKNEGVNPTGAQKDRALSVAISHAKAIGAPRVIVASTGSVGLACAAYCARAAIPCVVLVPVGVPHERLKPMAALGARVVEIDGTFEQVEALLAALDGRNWYQASTIRHINPYQAEGAKTIAYEIAAQLGRAPDWMVVPIGGGGTLHGIWRGFVELRALGRIAAVPRMVGVQPTAYDALARAMENGLTTAAEIEGVAPRDNRETVSRNLKHAVPPDGLAALAAVRESGGAILAVSDEDALRWQAVIGAEEGIFCEPSSAVSGAAVARLIGTRRIKPDDTVVSLITGSGFREVGVLPERELPRLPASATPADLDRLAPLPAA